MRRRARLGLAVLAVVLGIAGCSSVNTSGESPKPAGKSPSAISRMVCAKEASGEIAEVVGAKASVTAPTWADHLYSGGFLTGRAPWLFWLRDFLAGPRRTLTLTSWPRL